MNAVIELEKAYNRYKDDRIPAGLTEYSTVCRTSFRLYARRMTEDLGGAKSISNRKT